jgi:hypothetical protein
VESATRLRFGASAMKSRSSSSGARDDPVGGDRGVVFTASEHARHSLVAHQSIDGASSQLMALAGGGEHSLCVDRRAPSGVFVMARNASVRYHADRPPANDP